MSPVERKWWFVVPVCFVTTFCTRYLLESAGFPPIMVEFNVVQWIIYFLCFCVLWRGFSFAGWLLVLGISPSMAGARTQEKSS